MLASRGFVYADEAKAGKYDKFHDDCDCRIVPGFDDDAGIEGYSPSKLYKEWQELERGKKKSKENSFLGSGNAGKAESGTIKKSGKSI